MSEFEGEGDVIFATLVNNDVVVAPALTIGQTQSGTGLTERNFCFNLAGVVEGYFPVVTGRELELAVLSKFLILEGESSTVV